MYEADGVNVLYTPLLSSVENSGVIIKGSTADRGEERLYMHGGDSIILDKSRWLLQGPYKSRASSGGVGGRTNVRCHFPKPSEKRRIKRHGWEKRMSSFNGREILRRRILKGRHVLSHWCRSLEAVCDLQCTSVPRLCEDLGHNVLSHWQVLRGCYGCCT